MEIKVETIEPQSVMGILTHARQSEIGEKFGPLLGEVMGHVGDKMAGPPISRYHSWEDESHGVMACRPCEHTTRGRALTGWGHATGVSEAARIPSGLRPRVTHGGARHASPEGATITSQWRVREGVLFPGSEWSPYGVPPKKGPRHSTAGLS